MAKGPEAAGQERVPPARPVPREVRDRRDMIGVEGVQHAEPEGQCEDEGVGVHEDLLFSVISRYVPTRQA